MTGLALSPVDIDVSRETLDRLGIYHALLMEWNPRINLVSKSTIPAAWTRHILDSAQVFTLCPEVRHREHWLDIGSGGGFPGMVCAILAKEALPDLRFTLIESDKRKSVFLRTVAQRTGISVRICADRSENVPPQDADILSARALAPLNDLLYHVERHVAAGGMALLPKGVRYPQEITVARKCWHFDLKMHPSVIDAQAIILEMRGVRRVGRN
ncbi:MAG: 16S rRNA (guanine(527)-N(7))-methyltransferase RsmG [Pseudomonadota bacterium]